jgi:hypothetical protein
VERQEAKGKTMRDDLPHALHWIVVCHVHDRHHRHVKRSLEINRSRSHHKVRPLCHLQHVRNQVSTPDKMCEVNVHNEPKAAGHTVGQRKNKWESSSAVDG